MRIYCGTEDFTRSQMIGKKRGVVKFEEEEEEQRQTSSSNEHEDLINPLQDTFCEDEQGDGLNVLFKHLI